MKPLSKNFLMVSGVVLPSAAAVILAHMVTKKSFSLNDPIMIGALLVGAIAGGFYTSKILKGL